MEGHSSCCGNGSTSEYRGQGIVTKYRMLLILECMGMVLLFIEFIIIVVVVVVVVVRLNQRLSQRLVPREVVKECSVLSVNFIKSS